MNSMFSEEMDEMLTEIDALLVDRGSLLANRPLDAAFLIVQSNICEFSNKGVVTQYTPDSSANFVNEPWFGALYKNVEEWYLGRYGSVVSQHTDKPLVAVVLVFGTPFRLHVPCSLCHPGKPGQTVWVSFPDRVQKEEAVFDWLVNPPNLEGMATDMRTSLVANITEIAGYLRFVRTNLLGVRTDRALKGFVHGVMPHLQQAAELILRMNSEDIQKSYWELQMAIESALKALLQQKSGKYPPIHTLDELLRAANAFGPPFDCALLSALPKEREVSNLRYGQGSRCDVAGAFAAYRLALELIQSTVSKMDRMELGEARFEIQQPPWMRPQL